MPGSGLQSPIEVTVIDLTENDSPESEDEQIAVRVPSATRPRGRRRRGTGTQARRSAQQRRQPSQRPSLEEPSSAWENTYVQRYFEYLRGLTSGRQPAYVEDVIDLENESDDGDDDDDAKGVDMAALEEAVPISEDTPISTFKCPVCLDIPERLCATPCGHVYCSECVYQALASGPDGTKNRGNCAVCRKVVLFSQILYLEAWSLPSRDEEAGVGPSLSTATATATAS